MTSREDMQREVQRLDRLIDAFAYVPGIDDDCTMGNKWNDERDALVERLREMDGLPARQRPRDFPGISLPRGR